MRNSTRATVIEVLIAFMAVTLFVSIIRAAEPPQCNLPGWRPVQKVLKTIFATRAPRGHTHTCAHGHTWDHEANPTHTCQFCGMTQYVVDTPSRPVTIVKTVTVDAAPTVKQSLQVAPQPIMPLPTVSFGGCANGQCSTISRSRLLR